MPTPEELRQLSQAQGWSEDFARFSDPQVQAWINQYWDPGRQRFRSQHAPQGAGDWAYVEKPTEGIVDPATGIEYGPHGSRSGVNLSALGLNTLRGSTNLRGGRGGRFGGNLGGIVGPGRFGTAGQAPEFSFTPPSQEEALQDPGYQFALGEGLRALQGSAAARGTLRTGGTLRDLMDYGQQAATQRYGDVYGRQYQLARDEFAPKYGAWQTRYGGDLSRWTTRYGGQLQRDLQREGNIYGLLSAPPPSFYSY